MKRQVLGRNAARLAQQRALLVALSDDLALPLIHVKSSLELLHAKNFDRRAVQKSVQEMNLTTQVGLQLIEAYRLVLSAEDQELPTEPLAIGAVLEAIAHQLSPFAKQYSTELVVDVQGRLSPVLAHQPSLAAAIEVLGASLIRAQAAQSDQKKYKLVLGAHRATDGIISAGVFSNVAGLSDRSLRAARALVGKSRQPLPAVPPGAASGILIADMLCSTLWQPLRSAAHHNMHGLVTAVPTSKQLQFV